MILSVLEGHSSIVSLLKGNSNRLFCICGMSRGLCASAELLVLFFIAHVLDISNKLYSIDSYNRACTL